MEGGDVKLINTDGMVFIGPGSEWLWAALTGLVLAGTGIAIYRQLRVQQLQIHDNTKLLRSQAHYNAMLLAQRPWELLIENEALAGDMNVEENALVNARRRLADANDRLRQRLHVHAVQCVGILLLPAPRWFDPEGVVGGRR